MNAANHELADSVYRILSFDRLCQIFETQSLFLSHPSVWEDPYETFLSHNHSNAVFAQCWCKNGVSDAMWRIYSPGQLGVRVRTTRTILADQLALAERNTSYRYYVLDVVYLEQDTLSRTIERVTSTLNERFNSNHAAAALSLKRKAFSHESEVRVIAVRRRKRSNPTHASGLAVPIDPSQLVRGVLVDPRAPTAFVEAYGLYLRSKFGYKGPVRRSMLYSSPESSD